MTDEVPKGRRFSHVYMQRGKPSSDSKRMRLRLKSLLYSEEKDKDPIARHVQAELGTSIQYTGYYNWEKFFIESGIVDVLDSVTVIFAFMKVNWGKGYDRNAWLQGVRRIFREENVSYRVDDEGGVHLAVDDEFARNIASVVVGLGAARYGNSRAEFDAGMQALDQVPPDGKYAIRGVFGANESLFRLMFPSAPRLGAAEAEKYLAPLVQKAYVSDATAARALAKAVGAYKSWIDAAHFYRHEQGVEEPTQPPLEAAILLVSQGASFLRWLIELDQFQPTQQ